MSISVRAEFPVRERILDSYLAKVEGRRRERLFYDPAGLRRFATLDLGPHVRNLLVKSRPGPGMRMLLNLAELGSMTPCAEIALTVALDREMTVPERTISIRVVAAAGTAANRQALCTTLLEESDLDRLLAEALMADLFPGDLQVPDVFRILDHAADREGGEDPLRSVLEYVVPGRSTRAQRLELLQGLLARARANGDFIFTSDTDWLLPPIGRLLALEIEQLGPACLEMPAVREGLRWFQRIRDHLRHSGQVLEPLEAALKVQPELRHWLFWELASQAAERDGQTPTSCRQILSYDDIFKLVRDDLAWLVQDATQKEDAGLRHLAFDTACTFAASEDARPEDRAMVEALSRQEEAFTETYRRFITPREPDPRELELAARMREQEQEDQRRLEKDLRWLEARLNGLCTANDLDQSLVHLHRHLFSIGGDMPLRAPAKIEETYGAAVAGAARQGYRRYWRLFDPGIHGEPAPELQADADIGLVGLALDAAACAIPGDLPRTLLVRAVRYATHQLNGFPAWLADIAASDPSLVNEVLGPSLAAEYSQSLRDTPYQKNLDRLPWANPAVRRACLTSVHDLVRTGDPPALAPLKDALLVLLQEHGHLHAELADLAGQRCQAASENVRRMLWWCFWLMQDSTGALMHLKERLAGMSTPDADTLAQKICKQIYDWLDIRVPGLELPLKRDIRGAHRLLDILLDHIRPAEDIDLEERGATPGREAGQIIRDNLVRWIAESNETCAPEILATLAGDQRLESQREWVLDLLHENRTTRGPSRPWRDDQALQFVRSLIVIPRCGDELFQLILALADDITRFVEGKTSDYCYPELFRRPGLIEKDLQRWIARELEVRARGRFKFCREPAVVEGKIPDIRLECNETEDKVNIEVKLAGKWPGTDLEAHLSTQLVGEYMTTSHSRHGIYLLCQAGRPGDNIQKHWQPEGCPRLDFAALLDHLVQRADTIRKSNDHVRGLTVRGIDFWYAD